VSAMPLCAVWQTDQAKKHNPRCQDCNCTDHAFNSTDLTLLFAESVEQLRFRLECRLPGSRWKIVAFTGDRRED
jgi:hypothetical protein